MSCENLKYLTHDENLKISVLLVKYVFELNDEKTRKDVDKDLTNLINLEIAFAQDSSNKWYIICSEENNTADSINNNQLIVDLHVNAKVYRFTVFSATKVDITEL